MPLQGKKIKLHFSKAFDLEDCCDYVEVTDQDGTVLRGKGSKSSKPFVSKSAIVNVLFHTDGNVQRNGWSLFWGKLELSEKSIELTLSFFRSSRWSYGG